MVSVEGGNTPAWKIGSVLSLPESDATGSFPLCIRAMWMGLIGARVVSVCHCPWRFACPMARGAERTEDSEHRKKAAAKERHLLAAFMDNPFGLVSSCKSIKISPTSITGKS